MSNRKVFLLLSTLGAIVFVPYIAASLHFDGSFPLNYFKFPPESQNKAPASLFVIIGAAVVTLIIILVYVFPRWFGFKRVAGPVAPPIQRKYLPVWFWIGLVAFAVPLILFILKASAPKALIYWGLLPLFWGFTFMLDGVVFYLNDGKSLVRNNPTELVSMGVVSISGWLIFEYLNFFIRHNWFYPKADLLQHDEFLLYAVLGSSGFIPMAFEWYYLFRALRFLNNRFKHGRKVKLPKWLLWTVLVLSFGGLAATPVFPDHLFYIIWLAPLFIMSVVLNLLGIWTPFTPLRQGDWTALLVFALTFLVQGFLLEWWNSLSGYRLANGELFSHNPAYWVYCIPYVSKFHIFEMPILGYTGYLFFSLHCYIWWIILYHLMGISVTYGEQEDFK